LILCILLSYVIALPRNRVARSLHYFVAQASLNEPDVGLRNTIAKDTNEGEMERNGVKRNNEGVRNQNEGVMERNGVKRNNEGVRNHEESIYLAHSSNVTLNLFIVFNSFICRTMSSILPSPWTSRETFLREFTILALTHWSIFSMILL
jgi:hypothetical protein